MPPEPLILFPRFRLDVGNEQLWRDNELLTVRPKPFAVLAYLATHPDRLVTAAELRTAVWPQTYVGEGLLRGYRFLPAVSTPSLGTSNRERAKREMGNRKRAIDREQSGVHSPLRRTLPQWRYAQYGLRRINGQPSDQQTLCEAAEYAMDATGAHLLLQIIASR